MNIKKYVFVAIGMFVTVVIVAIGISARFSLSNITADPYAFIENFFNQWSPALGAASTIILVLTIFWNIHDSRCREERGKQQVVHALHDEIRSNMNDIARLRFQISERVRKDDDIMVRLDEVLPFQPIDTAVFDSMKNGGQLHWLEDMRMHVIFCYKLTKQYNQDATFKPYHLELLANIYEGLDKAIRDLEAKFRFLPHYLKEESESQEAETGDGVKDSRSQEHHEASVHKPPNNILKEYILFQAPAYFLASLLFMQLSGLSKQGGKTRFPIGNFEIPFLDERIYIGVAILLLTWTLVICIAPYNDRLMKKIIKVIEAITKPLYVVISIIVFGVGWIQGLVAMLNTRVSAGYFYLFFIVGLLMLGLIVVYPWYAHWKQKHRIY